MPDPATLDAEADDDVVDSPGSSHGKSELTTKF